MEEDGEEEEEHCLKEKDGEEAEEEEEELAGLEGARQLSGPSGLDGARASHRSSMRRRWRGVRGPRPLGLVLL